MFSYTCANPRVCIRPTFAWQMRCLFFPDFVLHRYYYCPFTEITIMYVPKRVKFNLMVKIRLKIIALFTRQVYEIIIRMSDTIGKHLWLLYFEDNFVELIACIPKRPQIWSNPREHPSLTRSNTAFHHHFGSDVIWNQRLVCVCVPAYLHTAHVTRSSTPARSVERCFFYFFYFFIFIFYDPPDWTYKTPFWDITASWYVRSHKI